MKTKPTQRGNQENIVDITKNIIGACNTLIEDPNVYRPIDHYDYLKMCNDIQQKHNTRYSNVLSESTDELFFNILKEGAVIKRHKTNNTGHFIIGDEETFVTIKEQRKILKNRSTFIEEEHDTTIEMQEGDTEIYRANGEIGRSGAIPYMAKKIEEDTSEVKRGLIIMGENSFIETCIHDLVEKRFIITSATEHELMAILERIKKLA